LAERDGRIHLQTIENTKALTIRPVLDAKLDPDTDRVVTDANAVYDWSIPKEKHERTSHKQELHDDGFIRGTWSIETAFSLFKRGGMLRSEMMISETVFPSCKRASNPSSAVQTSYPADFSSIEVLLRMLASSSTTRTKPLSWLFMDCPPIFNTKQQS